MKIIIIDKNGGRVELDSSGFIENGSHDIAAQMLLAQDGQIECSVDISTCDDDSGRRALGDFSCVNSFPGSDGFGSRSVEMLFCGSLND